MEDNSNGTYIDGQTYYELMRDYQYAYDRAMLNLQNAMETPIRRRRRQHAEEVQFIDDTIPPELLERGASNVPQGDITEVNQINAVRHEERDVFTYPDISGRHHRVVMSPEEFAVHRQSMQTSIHDLEQQIYEAIHNAQRTTGISARYLGGTDPFIEDAILGRPTVVRVDAEGEAHRGQGLLDQIDPSHVIPRADDFDIQHLQDMMRVLDTQPLQTVREGRITTDDRDNLAHINPTVPQEGDYDVNEMIALEAMLAADDASKEIDKVVESVVAPLELPTILIDDTWVKMLTDRGWSLEENSAQYLTEHKKYLYSQMVITPMSYVPNYSHIVSFTNRSHSLFFTNISESSFVRIRNIFKKIPYIMQCCEELYPDRWDMIYADNELLFTIYFPEVKITDSNANREHTMIDVYAIICIKTNGEIRINTTRATLSNIEVLSDYTFSHAFDLNYHTVTKSEVCTGTSELVNLLAEISAGGSNVDNSILLLIAQMENFLSFENSASPTKRIANIGVNGLFKSVNYSMEAILLELKKLLSIKKNREALSKLASVTKRDAKRLKIELKESTFLKSLLMSIDIVPKCYVNTDTNAYINDFNVNLDSAVKNNPLYAIHGRTMLTFRDVAVIGKVTKTELKIDKSSFILTIRPSIIQLVANTFSSIINNYLTKKSL